MRRSARVGAIELFGHLDGLRRWGLSGRRFAWARLARPECVWGYRVSAHPRVSFSGVFLITVCCEWTHETMTHRDGTREREDVCVGGEGERTCVMDGAVSERRREREHRCTFGGMMYAG